MICFMLDVSDRRLVVIRLRTATQRLKSAMLSLSVTNAVDAAPDITGDAVDTIKVVEKAITRREKK